VVLVVFDGVQSLDIFGPSDVFYFANYLAARDGHCAAPYEVELAAVRPGPVRTSAGPEVLAPSRMADPDLRPDLLLVPGGLSVAQTAGDADFIEQLQGLADRSEEVGSVCTGALLLAEAGLLAGRQATTHWALAEQMARTHPDVLLDADRIFVHDGVWSSAGVTAGIDLALEIVRRHHGSEMSSEAARNLVVYMHRAGGQRQYSTHLAVESVGDQTINDLLAFIADNPEADLSVGALAQRVGMAQRSFQRQFTREVGTSPGKYVERVRIDCARRLLERTDDGLARVSRRCGYPTVETFHRSFTRVVGLAPGEYRNRFRDPALH
jgi:transcriptional regulator GlxA family with amidase domain